MLQRMLQSVAVATLIGISASAAWSQQDIRWGTPPVGTAGHKAGVALANVLNKEMPQYRISVLPTAGAIATVKGYATKELDGFYGSDVAFRELANDTDRFKGFKARVQRMPIQSFWSNTIETGLAIHVRNKDKIKSWADLNGKRIFTGPLPFDTRAQTERTLAAIGVKFTYVQVDLVTVGSQLEFGALDAMSIYTASEKRAAAVARRSLARRRLGRAQPERRRAVEMKKKGLAVTEVTPKTFNRDTHTDKVVEMPFYYGFDVGLEVPEADVYKMLTIIEKNGADLAKIDPTFSQVSDPKKMAEFQKRGVESSWDLVPIHPGLAKWMRERVSRTRSGIPRSPRCSGGYLGQVEPWSAS